MTGLDVEAVLVAHHAEVQIKGDKPIGWRCSAGDWISSGTHGDGTEFAAHVAAVLRVEIESALADAWDEGHEAGSQDETDAYWGTDLDSTPNPYRASLAATEGDRQ